LDQSTAFLEMILNSSSSWLSSEIIKLLIFHLEAPEIEASSPSRGQAVLLSLKIFHN